MIAFEIRHALRQMRNRPGFTAMMLAALGLGIGASVALVSVVNTLVLRPLPYAGEARVHVFWMDYSWTYEEYDFLKERLGHFDDLAVFSTDGATYASSARSAEGASVLSVVVSSPTLFSVLGVRPMLGRLYDANDSRPEAAPVVVISYGMWQQDLGGDRAVIGRQILLDGKPVPVIGVMPRDFFFPVPDLRAWRPLQVNATQPQYKNAYLTVVAHTRSGISDAQVNAEIRRLSRALHDRFTYPAAWDHGRDAATVPVHTYVLGKVREPLLLLLGAVALLLLIACANAAALVLARATDRSAEMGVRAALGASAWRLARQVLAESLVLALCAAALGSLVATAGFRILVARLRLAGGLDKVASIGGASFIAAFILALVIAFGISIVPVRHLLRGTMGVNRERSEQGLRRGARRVHGAIIGAQVAFAVLLVVGATLLIRSVENLRSIDPGFDSRGVTTYSVVLGDGIPRGTRARALQDVVNRVAAVPGVTAAGITNRLPVRDLGYQTVVSVEGRADLEGASRPTSLYRTTTPAFFAAMGMRLVAGRVIDSTDTQSSLPVVVISESFANAMWPGQNALGKQIAEAWSGTKVSRTVVGVMRETQLTGLTAKAPFALWIPLAQTAGPSAGVLVVKSHAPAAVIMPAVRRAIRESDSRLAVARTQTMSDAVDMTLAAPLRLRFFFSVFAALALALGAIGVFGVVSYAAARRRPEFAVRMALGASPATIGGEVLRFGLAPVFTGIAVGSVVALASARWIGSFLYGVLPKDGASVSVAAATLLCAATLAALLPAMRAGRTNPADALRGDSA